MVNKYLKKQNWSNHENADFYEKMSTASFENLLSNCGLSNNVDLDLIYPFIRNSKSVLEVGAGYGRVLDCLITHKFPGDLFAIERSEKFCIFLREKYRKSVEVYHGDFLEPIIPDKIFDSILWLWCGMSDFPYREQYLALKNLVDRLKEKGLLIIDIANALYIPQKKRYQTLQYENSRINRCAPTDEHIDYYASKLGLAIKEKIDYRVPQSIMIKDRSIYILSKLRSAS